LYRLIGTPDRIDGVTLRNDWLITKVLLLLPRTAVLPMASAFTLRLVLVIGVLTPGDEKVSTVPSDDEVINEPIVDDE
jgi:hypothetical protein